MANYPVPGVYIEELFPARSAELPTGVPAFLGYVAQCPPHRDASDLGPYRLTRREQFLGEFGTPLMDSFLFSAIDGFFANGGRECYVAPLDFRIALDAAKAKDQLEQALATLTTTDAIDLICIPDLETMCRGGEAAVEPDEKRALALALQRMVMKHCDELNDRFALLEPVLRLTSESFSDQIDRVIDDKNALHGTNGALYFPWINVRDWTGVVHDVPPCGHIAGVFARSDRAAGVHKAPANELLEGVVDLALDLDEEVLERLHTEAVNALRALTGRGIRVWGARTVSSDPAWTYVNVRRIFLTTIRWIERTLGDVAFEPNGPPLWNRITRQLTAYLGELYRQGALKGASAAEAFYVKCDAETNPPEQRETGRLTTEIGLAPLAPAEFVIVRIEQNTAGVNAAG